MARYLKQLNKRWLPRFHRDLFAWHCQKFFPFDQVLRPCEHGYLERCFQLAQEDSQTNPIWRRCGYYSYSHRVRGVDINSSRLMFGTLTHPEEAWEAACPILQLRGISPLLEPSQDNSLTFYGLGWDFFGERFKLYYRFSHPENIPLAWFQGMLTEVSTPCASEGIVAFHYHKNERHDEKVYLFPRLDEPPGMSSHGSRILMLSSQHGMMSLYDRSSPKDWLPQLNPQGQRIVQFYRAYGEELCTLRVENANHFTLYYP